jgi:hypothetical protein
MIRLLRICEMTVERGHPRAGRSENVFALSWFLRNAGTKRNLWWRDELQFHLGDNDAARDRSKREKELPNA